MQYQFLENLEIGYLVLTMLSFNRQLKSEYGDVVFDEV